MTDSTPTPDRKTILADCGKIIDASIHLVTQSAPVQVAKLGVVTICIDPQGGGMQMSGNMPLDMLMVALAKAMHRAQELAAAQPPKLVLPPGAIDPRRN